MNEGQIKKRQEIWEAWLGMWESFIKDSVHALNIKIGRLKGSEKNHIRLPLYDDVYKEVEKEHDKRVRRNLPRPKNEEERWENRYNIIEARVGLQKKIEGKMDEFNKEIDQMNRVGGFWEEEKRRKRAISRIQILMYEIAEDMRRFRATWVVR